MPISIPLPERSGPAFMRGAANSQNMIDSMMKNRLNPYQMELLKAQTEQASGAAAKSKMLANLINQAMGGANGEQNGNPQGNSPNNGLLISGLLGLPTHVVEGNIVTPFGTQKVGESNEEKRQGEATRQINTQTAKESAKSYAAGQKIQDSIGGLRDVMSNPRYANLAGQPKALALGASGLATPIAMAARKIYSKEDQDLFGKANSYMGNLFAEFGHQFRGPFSGRVQGLVKDLKPNINESIEVQMGKVNALDTLNKIGQKREELIDQFMSQGMSSIQAMKMADQQLPFNKIKQAVELASKQVPNQQGVQNNIPPQQSPQNEGNEDQLNQWAQDAINRGADPKAVQERMNQMRGSQ